MPYPVTVLVARNLANRNRLTVAFRLILAIPHTVLVIAVGSDEHLSANGLLGAAAAVLAIVSWFTILFAGKHLPEIRQFTMFYLRWRARALAYVALLEDEYPPFGDGPYPVSIELDEPAGPRDRAGIAFRLLLAIPHLLVFFFVGIAWLAAMIIAWFAILLTGRHPQLLYDFGAGAMRWLLRLEAYLLLMVDEYPPFSLE